MSEEEQAAEHNTKSKCICLETVDPEESTLITLKCRHVYHTQCIADWLIEHGTCPYCRNHDGIDREAASIASTRSLETFNILMHFIIILHWLTMTQAQVMEGLRSVATILPEDIATLDGGGLVLEILCITLTCYVAVLVYLDLHKYQLLGIVCYQYVSIVRNWSYALVCLTVLEKLLMPVSLTIVCMTLLVLDVYMYKTYHESLYTIAVDITYTQHIYHQ